MSAAVKSATMVLVSMLFEVAPVFVKCKDPTVMIKTTQLLTHLTLPKWKAAAMLVLSLRKRS